MFNNRAIGTFFRGALMQYSMEEMIKDMPCRNDIWAVGMVINMILIVGNENKGAALLGMIAGMVGWGLMHIEKLVTPEYQTTCYLPTLR